MSTSTEFLDSLKDSYVTSKSPQDRMIRGLVFKTLGRFMGKTRGSTALELGCSDGFVTSMIANKVETLDVVDGSSAFLEQAKKRNIPNARFIHSLFEDFQGDHSYDYVFATYVLEHIDNPLLVLQNIRNQMSAEGLLLVAVPNARALSRQLARHMGLISVLTDLTPNDQNHGHKRVYDRCSLDNLLHFAGFKHIARGGVLLKPFADFQLDKLIECGVLGKEQIEGLYSLGFEYPDLCATLYSVCKVEQE